MKWKAIAYWIFTAFIALETLVGGAMDLTNGRTAVISGPHVVDVLVGLGYPNYTGWIIGMWKIPGAIVLLMPGLPRLKEWAYAGIVLELSGAVLSQAMCGRWLDVTVPLVLGILALASYALRPSGRILLAMK